MVGTGPKRQRNHLDELPHTLRSYFAVCECVRIGVIGLERGRTRDKRVSPENCGPSGSATIYDGSGNFSVEARCDESTDGRASREARVIHM